MRNILLLPLAALVLATACQKQQDNETATLNASIPKDVVESGNRTEPDNAAVSASGEPANGPVAPTQTNVTSRDAIPPAFVGRWTGVEARCADRSSDLRLSVTPKELRFYESVAKVTAVEGAGPSAILVDARYEGEGQTWSRRQKLTLSADVSLLTIASEGRAVTRKRCSTTP